MTTRRDFLQTSAGALAGLVFVGCDLLAASPARAQARRREVVVNGKRVKTVDVHAHCAVPEALALMNQKLAGPGLRTDLDMATEVAGRLKAMDEQGIDVEALSINPNWYKADRDLAKQIIAIQNEKLTEACAKNPDRFVAFATVALQHPLAIPSSTRSGPRPSNWGQSSSSIRRAMAPPPSSSSGSRATVISAT
jgi:aminocarboxymuconate-semialdehyde decarboxylase